MPDEAAALMRAARDAARRRLPEREALERIVGASVGATTADLDRALAATQRLPVEDDSRPEMRRLLLAAKNLGLFRSD